MITLTEELKAEILNCKDEIEYIVSLKTITREDKYKLNELYGKFIVKGVNLCTSCGITEIRYAQRRLYNRYIIVNPNYTNNIFN